MNCRICGKECTRRRVQVAIGDSWSHKVVTSYAQVCGGCVVRLQDRFIAIMKEFDPETHPEE